MVSWAGRLQGVGANLTEVAAIQAAYDVSTREVKRALNELIGGIDNAGLLQMLTSWRTGTGPFSAGMPGGGLPFGTEVPILTGNPADDTKAISAGTGIQLAVTGGSAPSPVTTYATLATSQDGSSRLLAAASGTFLGLAGVALNEVQVDPSIKGQSILGFGAALTDSSAWVLWSTMTKVQRTALFSNLFDPAQGGLSFVRLPMGASDFINSTLQSAYYSYDDLPSGQADSNALPNFSVAHDEAYIIPILREILAVNPRIKIIAAPWSPPAWMKTPATSLISGAINTAFFTALANYFVAFIQAYANHGIQIWGVTPQNEPDINETNMPSCTWTAAQETTFIGTFLGPAIDTAGLSTKIIVGDTGAYTTTYQTNAETDANAGPYLDGAAYHPYSGSASVMTSARRAYPYKNVYATEFTDLGGSGVFSHNFPEFAAAMMAALRNGASAFAFWNLALNENFKPSPVNAFEPVVVLPSSGTGIPSYRPAYYVLQQIGKYVRPGALRIHSTNFPSGVTTAAFQNPDGSIATILYNSTASAQNVVVSDGRGIASAPVTVPAGDLVTVYWTGIPAAPSSSDPAPSSPTGVTATSHAGYNALTWAEPTTGSLPSVYLLSRGTTSGGEAPYDMVPAGGSWNDLNATAGTTYFYTLIPYAEGGAGSVSAEVSAAATATPTPTLTVTGGGTNQLTASITGSQAPSSWLIKRGATSGSETLLTTVAANGTTTMPTYNDSAANGTYYYKVAAVIGSNTSADSAEQSGTIGGGPFATAGAGGTGTNTTATTAAINTTGATLLVVAASSFGNTFTLTDSAGNTWQSGTMFGGVSDNGVRIFYCKTPTTSATHTFSLHSDYPGIAVAAWSGTAVGTSIDGQNGTSTSSSVTTIQAGSITPVNSGDLIVAVGAGLTSPTIDSSFTIAKHQPGTGGQSVASTLAYLSQTTAAAVNPTWTWSPASGAGAAIAALH